MALALDNAIARYEAGDKTAAKRAASAIPDADGERGGALNLLAVIAQEEGQQAEAESLAREAMRREPANPIYLNTLGNGLLNQGRTADAIRAFKAAHELLPRHPDILFNLANAQRTAGALDAAAASYRAVIALAPGYVAARNNLALVLKAGGDREGAARVLMEAVAHNPRSEELRFNLGNTLHAAGRLQEAEIAYRAALALAPGYAEAHANLGVVLTEAGEKKAARECFEQAIALNRALVPAYVGLANLVDDGTLDAVAHRRAILALNPDLAAVQSSLLMCLHYVPFPRAELFAEHKAFGARHEPNRGRKHAALFAKDHDFTAGRRLRIGFVSSDFRFHAMLFFALPVMEAKNAGDVELFCYSATVRTDAETVRFRAAADHWRDIAGLSDDNLAQLIVRDRIDVLIDLSGHAPHNRLLAFAARPAPLQVAWGDYVDTRGLGAIDLLLGDPIHTPPADDTFFVERVVRFASDYVCYRPPADASSAAPAPAVTNGFLTFGTFSEITKIGPEAVAQWAAVLKALPDARFLLNGYLFADGARRGRIISLFMDQGITGERLTFRNGGSHREFLGQYAWVDAILDTAPYSGGLTTCEALLMGVPVLTVAGDRFCGRHASAHLANGGYPEGVANSVAELVAKAKALAADRGALSASRRELRRKFLAAPLCNVQGFAKSFYGALRAAWTERCALTPRP